MPSSFSRGPLTTRLLAELVSEGFPVGDDSAPLIAFGWQGEPNSATATFIPWLTLTPGAASLQTPQSMFDSQCDWRVGYNVFFAAVTRKQAEALADRMRMNLTNIAREQLDTPTGVWQIQKLTCTAIGSTNRVGSAYPDYFTQADTFEVWITKG